MGNVYIYINCVCREVYKSIFVCVCRLFDVVSFTIMYVCVCAWGDGQGAADRPYACVKPPRCDIVERSGCLTPSLQLHGMTLRVVDNSSASFLAQRRPAAASPLEFSSPPRCYVSISPAALPQTDPAHPLSRRAPTDRSGDQVYLQILP